MARKKKMVDRVKYFGIQDGPDDGTRDRSVELEGMINAWLEETPDVQVVQICYDQFFREAFLHYRKLA